MPAFWLVVLFTVPIWLQDQYILHILITTGIFIIAAMSLNLLLGYTGQLSLGHVAFFGIGAYASALTTLGFDVELLGGFRVVHEPWPAIAGFFVGIVIAGISGYAIGRLSFKVRGAYFVIVTISFAEVTRLVALELGGADAGSIGAHQHPSVYPGLSRARRTTRFGERPGTTTSSRSWGSWPISSSAGSSNSRIGRAMIALKENETLASSVGIDVTRYLVLAAVVSAAIAGSAGSLYAHYLKIIDPDIFLFIYTVTMVIMVITGGKGTLAGPIVGGIIFGFLPVIVRPIAAPAVQWILYGALMIVIVFVLPQGIVPAVERWIANWTQRKRKRARDDLGGQHQAGRRKLMPDRIAPGEVVLSIEHVTVHFGGLVALSDLNFTVRDGEIVGLIGPNGAGKTTAFNVFTGYSRPTHGEVRYRGTLLNGLEPHEIADLGLVQDVPAHEHISEQQRVRERADRLASPRTSRASWKHCWRCRGRRAEERELADKAHEILRLVGLEPRAAELAGTLPYGEQRLLGIALALAAQPSMLLLDEPVSGMNPSETAKVMKLVETIRASGVTILLVEHDMPMVMQVSDRIVVLNYGRIIAEGPPAVIQNNPDVIRAYLGEGKKRA